MTLTASQIGFAIVAVVLNVIIFLWFRRNKRAASARRMMGMMGRTGLDAGTAVRGDPQVRAVLSESRRRCRRCPREDFCDRWLAGKVEGDNAFCANAGTFRSLVKAYAPKGWPSAIRPAP